MHQLRISDKGADYSEQLDRLHLLLRHHVGKGDAIQGMKIARFLSEDYVTTREMIRDLVIQRKIPVGSCGLGYYICETPEEVDEVCASLKSRAMSILVRMAALKKIKLETMLDQLKDEMVQMELDL